VAVGSELVDAKLIRENRYEEMEQRARQYLDCISRTRGELKAAAA
jgi:2-keto-3-deoxy-6-phosphogluconate aldolase